MTDWAEAFTKAAKRAAQAIDENIQIERRDRGDGRVEWTATRNFDGLMYFAARRPETPPPLCNIDPDRKGSLEGQRMAWTIHRMAKRNAERGARQSREVRYG